MFNLANQYHANKLYQEAINTYLLIVKNKMFSNGSKLSLLTYMNNVYRGFQMSILGVLLLEGKHIIKRQLYTRPFTLEEVVSLPFGTGGRDSV